MFAINWPPKKVRSMKAEGRRRKAGKQRRFALASIIPATSEIGRDEGFGNVDTTDWGTGTS
jgi:hypothetical protein